MSNKSFSKADPEKIIAAYNKGLSIREVAVTQNLCSNVVYAILREHQVPLRPAHRKLTLTDAALKEAVELYISQTLTTEQLGKRYQLSVPTMLKNLRRGGATVPRPRTTLTDEEKERAAQLYASGMRLDNIAQAGNFHCTGQAVVKFLRENVPVRRPGHPKRTIAPEKLEQAIGMYVDAGLSMMYIAHELKIGESTLSRIFREAGVTMALSADKRKRPEGTAKQTAFRLEPELLEGLSRAAEKLQTKNGPSWTRTDALKYFIHQGLQALGLEEAKR